MNRKEITKPMKIFVYLSFSLFLFSMSTISEKWSFDDDDLFHILITAQQPNNIKHLEHQRITSKYHTVVAL